MWTLLAALLLPTFSCSRLSPALVVAGSLDGRGHDDLADVREFNSTQLLAQRLRHVSSSSSSQGIALRPDGEAPVQPRPVAEVAEEAPSPQRREEAQEMHAPTEEEAFIDVFFFMYWGIATLLFVIGVYALAAWRAKIKQRKGGEADDEDEPEPYTLSENLWSLNLISALGQVKFGNGEPVPAALVAGLSLFMGALQLAAVTLMVGAIDPLAKPITTRPASPWLQDASPFPVNMMKWCMVTFLTVGQVGEVAQCRRLVTQTLLVNPKRLNVGRWMPLAAAALQYSVSLSVVWGGVAVILCFQTVPDIIYSSMSVFFITSADEMFYQCIETIVDLEADWSIQVNTMNSTSTTPRDPDGMSARSSGGHHAPNILHHSLNTLMGTSEPLYKAQELPDNVWWLLKVLQMLPLLFGFFIISRAFYTGVMPTKRFHAFGLW